MVYMRLSQSNDNIFFRLMLFKKFQEERKTHLTATIIAFQQHAAVDIPYPK